MFIDAPIVAICTKIQYNVGMDGTPRIDTKRIDDEIKRLSERRGVKVTLPALAEEIGEKYDRVFKAVKDKDRRVAADLVAKLAMLFGCSIDYLMGMTDKRDPITLTLNEFLEGLVAVAKTLPDSRQHDLLLIARAYAESKVESERLVFREMREIIGVVADEMGKGGEFDSLIQYMDQRERAAPSAPILSVGTEEPQEPDK